MQSGSAGCRAAAMHNLSNGHERREYESAPRAATPGSMASGTTRGKKVRVQPEHAPASSRNLPPTLSRGGTVNLSRPMLKIKSRKATVVKKVRTFIDHASSISMSDITSLLDILLLMDTLMAGFQIALLTAPAIERTDIMGRDAFNFKTTLVENNLDELFIPVASHHILLNGMVATTAFFTSIAVGISTYLNFNLSRAREDAEVGDRFSKWFLPFVLFGYICFITGIFFFFMCFTDMLKVIYPNYCTKKVWQPIDDYAVLFDENGGTEDSHGMLEITAEMFEDCRFENFFHNYLVVFQTILMVAFPGVIFAGFIINIYIDCTHVEAAYSAQQTDIDGDGHADTLHEMLHEINPAFEKYEIEMNAADIAPSQLPQLEFAHLIAIGVTVGDALRIIEHFKKKAAEAQRLKVPPDVSEFKPEQVRAITPQPTVQAVGGDEGGAGGGA